MSRIVNKDVICSSCGTSIRAAVYESVNVTTEPALKEKVLSRTINGANCPQCGLQMAVATNLLYHDVDKKFMVWLRLNEHLEKGEEAPELGALSQRLFSSYRLRIVSGWPELSERIHVLESGLDEGLVELLKFVLWPQIPGNTPENFTGSGLYFTGADRIPSPVARLRFVFLHGASPEIFSYPRSEYDKLVSSPDHKRVIPPAGEWTSVNHRYVIDRWL